MSILAAAGSLAQLGLELLTIKPKRGFFSADGATSIVAHATIEELHSDEAEITDHPVEQGATISDHAFVRPSEVIITAGWSNSPSQSGPIEQLRGIAANASPAVQAVLGATSFVGGVINIQKGSGDAVKVAYDALREVYVNRTLLDVFTGRHIYKNMLIKSLVLTTDHRTENSMLIRITCRQILMATTQTAVFLDPKNMKNPEKNAAPINRGTISPIPTLNFNPPGWIRT